MSRAASQTQLVHVHRKLDTANGCSDTGEGYSREAFSIFRDGGLCVNSSDIVPCEIQQSRQHLRESRTAPHCWHPPSIRASQVSLCASCMSIPKLHLRKFQTEMKCPTLGMKRTLVSSTDTHFRGTEPGKPDDNAVDGLAMACVV